MPNKKTKKQLKEERKTQKELRKNWLLEIENERRLGLDLNIFMSYDELEEYNQQEDIDNNSINLKNDYQLIESTNIMNDFLNLSKKTMLSSLK